MSVAKLFIESLRAGDINEAIETIKGGLKETTVAQIEEARLQILESYGFVAEMKDEEEKEEIKEEEDDSESDEEEDEKEED